MSVEGRAFVGSLRQEVERSLCELSDVKATWHQSVCWTEFMLGNSKSRKDQKFGVLGRVGSALGYRLQAEYLRVDQIWYSCDPAVPSDWLIEAFLEHENDIDRVPETIRKLLHLGAGLKVLVTYPESKSGEKVLQTISELIRNRYGVALDTKLLLVLGELKESRPLWRGYEFDGIGRMHPLFEGG